MAVRFCDASVASDNIAASATTVQTGRETSLTFTSGEKKGTQVTRHMRVALERQPGNGEQQGQAGPPHPPLSLHDYGPFSLHFLRKQGNSSTEMTGAAVDCTSGWRDGRAQGLLKSAPAARICGEHDQSMTMPNRTGKSALDEFLPERLFAPNAQRNGGATHIDPSEVQLEAIEVFQQPVPAGNTPPSQVQALPMFAAALVAIGVSLLALVVFERFGLP